MKKICFVAVILAMFFVVSCECDHDIYVTASETQNENDFINGKISDIQYDADKTKITCVYDKRKPLSLDLKTAKILDDGETHCLVFQGKFSGKGVSKESKEFRFDLSENKGGLLLSFDDYFSTWENFLPIFKKYSAKATFFCFGNESRILDFCNKAQNAGQEVGYHALKHNAWTSDTTEQDVYDLAVAPLTGFLAKGIFFDSFAFVGGKYQKWMVDYLKKYYKIIRFFDATMYLYTRDEIKQQRAIHTRSIDEGKFQFDDEILRDVIFRELVIARILEKVIPYTTHYIRKPGENYMNGTEIYNNYTIKQENLEWLLQTANDLRLPTLLYKDLY